MNNQLLTIEHLRALSGDSIVSLKGTLRNCFSGPLTGQIEVTSPALVIDEVISCLEVVRNEEEMDRDDAEEGRMEENSEAGPFNFGGAEIEADLVLDSISYGNGRITDVKGSCGLHDTILNLEVTPNRPDCLSVIGIAREIAALTGQNLHLPAVNYQETTAPIDQQVAVEIIAPDLCPRYCASLIKGVKIADSPGWMQQRLLACGMRPINNIVDITNYVMLEYGQPLHAFDYASIGGKKIVVRRAAEGEPVLPARDLGPGENDHIENLREDQRGDGEINVAQAGGEIGDEGRHGRRRQQAVEKGEPQARGARRQERRGGAVHAEPEES